ncbi:metabotropic glutamate receptor 4 isoform X3 [Macrosteles quadrilineatus]|uniref:metabotropic glutamate receptor 4 isoform X3 n=1 Tax=Macrosteles quadrilineatus TaxID=74068 RepID=UPI0023E1C4DA|nr:metabotropic glutamate receptor 4 isoform X3 [Macrosteles quadrilineatus]
MMMGSLEGAMNASQGRLELTTEYFLVPTPLSSPASSDPPPLPPATGYLRRDMWVAPLLIFSSLTMILIALFEVFVLLKTWRTTPSRRHLFLGQMLLLGLFLCAAVAALLSAEPTVVTCAGVRLGAGLAYSLVFSTLLVKCVFLISLNGGVYLPAPYQALLLFFAVLIQLAIGAQWLINNPPKVIQVGLHQACHTPYHHLLLSLVYAVFLIVVVAVLAVKSRGIRDNYREATFIGLAVACVIPVWLGWALCGLVVLERNRDACLAFGLSGSALIVFLIMFMPKLAAMGREGMYVEDREEKFSSLSRAASPSFFHFKPIKQPPITTHTYGSYSHSRTKICTVSDRVALVAPPPSYGHPHHYYPYCYYPHARPMPGSGFDASMYTTVEPTLSTNPNVFFHRGLHPGLMY